MRLLWLGRWDEQAVFESSSADEITMKPSRINVSVGTAGALGLADVPMAVAPTTAYLMLGGRCLMNCKFCAQARESRADALRLSRVTWPEYDLDAVVECLVDASVRGDIRRVCLQVTVTADALAHSLALLRAVKAASELPFDVAILPQDLGQVHQLLAAGADHIGFGLDAACRRVFRLVKGGNWGHSLTLIQESALTFPGHVAVHLIAGLGETEREMVERMQWAHDLGMTVGLFAFTPVHGARLADSPPPSLSRYRRMQAARWLIAHDLSRLERMAFDGTEQLLDLGGSLPSAGEPFQTSGCRDCNRPYYNERPGGLMYNYPRPLTAGEAVRAIQEMEIKVEC